MADPIKVWQNDAQQLFEMNQDLASVNAAGVESDGQLAFFVGKPTNGNQWTLKKITPNELGKLVYDYLTSSSIASQLASVLGGSVMHHYFEYDNFQSPINIGKAIGLVIVISSATGNYAASLCTTISDPIALRTSGVISISRSEQNTIATCTSPESSITSRKVFVIVVGRII